MQKGKGNRIQYRKHAHRSRVHTGAFRCGTKLRHLILHDLRRPATHRRRNWKLVLDCYRKDEWGDALLFAHLFEHRCVYDHMEKAWYLWQGHFWKRDEVGR